MCLAENVNKTNVRKMPLNAEQEKALSAIEKGHNLVLLGAAGTGKSHVVGAVKERCLKNKKTCAITATTGIACSVYPAYYSAMTIHRWTGIGDGRYSPNEISRIVSSNVNYKDVLDRIMKTDVLIIDECSMMSSRLIESVDQVCRLKNGNLYFGGIQVVLVGDFMQLPPVPCARYGEEGAFCFESDIFTSAFPHRIILKDVVRQHEHSLVKAVSEVSLGNVTAETEELMKKLDRPLTGEVTKLFATNDLVDDHNHDQICKVEGQLHEFLSTDYGDKHNLSYLKAPRNLWIKKGIPVLLTKNLSDRLVNGLRGKVMDIRNERNIIIVDFRDIREKVQIERTRFEVFDPRKNAVVAWREQFPLKPSFAITIHKSQGMTMEKVEVHCKDIFKPGQLGVAIGRAKSLDGLRVVNFSTKCCIRQPEKITLFLRQADSIDMEENKTCCNGKLRQHQGTLEVYSVADVQEICERDDDAGPGLEEIDDDFDTLLANLDDFEDNEVSLPEGFDLNKMLENMKSETLLTPLQYKCNDIISRISQFKLEHFVKQEFSKLSQLLDEAKCSETGQVLSKDLGIFFTKVHKHANSLEFRMACLKLFENENLYSVAHQRICFNISVEIRKFIIAEKAKKIQVVKKDISKRTLTHASRARVRYVGGYCIAKVRHKYTNKKACYRFSSKQCDQIKYQDAKCALNTLDGLIIDEQSIHVSTHEPDSLLDIARRQNLNRALTNISDMLFIFFINLTEKCLGFFVDENVNKFGADMFKVCQKDMMSYLPLYEEFVQCCTGKEEINMEDVTVEEVLQNAVLKVSQFEQIYKSIMKQYLMVMFNQFRKDALNVLNVEKKMAHRKQIRVSVAGKKDEIGSKEGKQTETKHKRGNQIDTSSGPKKTKKTEIRSKKRKTVQLSSSTTADSEDLQLAVVSLSSMSTDQPPSAFTPHTVEQKSQHADTGVLSTPISTDLQPSTSQTDELSLQQSDLAEEEELMCNICNTFSKEELWIQCCNCESWLHRGCAGLKHHLRWKKYQKKGAKFVCTLCM